MKTLVFIFSSLILFSCNSQKREANSDNGDYKKASLLAEGEHYVEIDSVKLWYLVQGNGQYSLFIHLLQVGMVMPLYI